jgi:hypothetical protein
MKEDNMGRKKDPEKKTRIEEVRESLEREHQEYLAKTRPQPVEDNQDAKEAFKVFWTLNRKKYNRPKELEEILWAHMKAAGFDKPELFEEGIEHFGLKAVGV